MQRQALNPDKGDSVWKRRALVQDRVRHAGGYSFLFHTLERLSHIVATINTLRLAWKRCNANSLALAMYIIHDISPHCAV